MASSAEPLEITGNELVHMLRTPREPLSAGGCAVLDCRPFLDFSRAHICESRNVNWNSMLRRRSKSSVVALEWLVPDKALLGRLRRGDFSPVVVVEGSSRRVAELRPESVAQMLLSALRNEVHTQICFLQGDFTANTRQQVAFECPGMVVERVFFVLARLWRRNARAYRCFDCSEHTNVYIS